jgi:DNA-binding NarL/FixJ family response regulator
MAREVLQVFQLPSLTAAIEFSKREREVLEMLSMGLRYKEIAVKLSVGTATVRTYLERAYGKLGVTNRTEAVVRFMEHRR